MHFLHMSRNGYGMNNSKQRQQKGTFEGLDFRTTFYINKNEECIETDEYFSAET